MRPCGCKPSRIRLTPERAKELAAKRKPANMKRNVNYADLARLSWARRRYNQAQRKETKP